MHVGHLDGDRFEIGIRRHRVTVDQPVDAGGEDTAPTPTELFIASLASCGVPESRREPLLAVASHCTVHNTLTTEPEVAIHLVEPEAAEVA
ncbi:OsmC family protein [Knoellia sp. p5-6-4]|uniref:OsmC family protein n=1 Tax=unclassified Knoellia TaxID=2618719 RepID=UPI0023DA5542|nr:hypothetical protein [Knoellia sp. p5-6-4]MDF2146736.1 hypothetical protein [Knoellia sp. p5-6-4]